MGSYSIDLTSRVADAIGGGGNSGAGSESSSAAVVPNEAPPQGGGESTPPPSPPSPVAPAVESPATTENVETPVEAPEQEEFQFEDESLPEVDESEDRPWAKMLPKEVEAQFLKTPRGRMMLQQFKVAQELSKPIAEGGLGRIPTVEEIRESSQDSSSLELMTHEFHNAHQDPIYGPNWIRQWFQPVNGMIPQGAMAVARAIPGVMAELSPDYYKAVAVPIAVRYMEEWYEKAAAAPDEQTRILFFNVARQMEQDLTGKYREVPESLWKEGRPQAGGVDPRQVELDSKLQQINNFQRQQQQHQLAQFNQSVNTTINGLVMADIKAALKPIEGTLSEESFNDAVDGMYRKVIKTVNGSPENLRNFNILIDRAKSTRQRDDVFAAAVAWRNLARPIIRGMRTGYIKNAASSMKAQSDSRHSTLQEASQKISPGGVQQPTQKDLGSPVKRLPGETHEEFLLRRTRELLTVG